MQIVIEMPEAFYEALRNTNIIIVSGRQSGKTLTSAIHNVIYNAVVNGTPLPKGHGRLIDEDLIAGDGSWDWCDRLDATPTIIEADKEDKE